MRTKSNQKGNRSEIYIYKVELFSVKRKKWMQLIDDIRVLGGRRNIIEMEGKEEAERQMKRNETKRPEFAVEIRVLRERKRVSDGEISLEATGYRWIKLVGPFRYL